MKNYEQKVKVFKEHVENTCVELQNQLDVSGFGGYEKRFDVQISVNGKSVNIGMNADSYINLLFLLDEELNNCKK